MTCCRQRNTPSSPIASQPCTSIQHGTPSAGVLFATVLFLSATTGAFADPKTVKSPDDPKPIDADAVLDKLIALRDDQGGIYILPKPGSFENNDAASKWVFYGDAKVVYQQRLASSFASPRDAHHGWYVWAPRTDWADTWFGIENRKPTLRCSEQRQPLIKLSPDETRSLLKDVKFYPPLWKREAKFLARDDDGTYYYVDELQKEYGGRGYRVFVGQKGSMKQLVMTNVVSDSAGEIYATKNGRLKIIADSGPIAFWVNRKKKHPLTVLPVRENLYLIYRDLGIYGRLGTICDDL